MEVQHFCHEHPLVYYEEKTKRSFCYLCGEKILDYSYRCIKCKWFYLHKSCFELSQSLSSELHHPLHRKHSLVLTKDRPYGYRLKCNHCKEFLDRSYSFFYSMSNSSFYYRCLSCEFYLHLGCASLPPLLHTVEVEIHDHSLTLLRKLITFTCDACGKEGKDTPYLCLTCAFCVHPICASLHRTVYVTTTLSISLILFNSNPTTRFVYFVLKRLTQTMGFTIARVALLLPTSVAQQMVI